MIAYIDKAYGTYYTTMDYLKKYVSIIKAIFVTVNLYVQGIYTISDVFRECV